MSRYPLWAVLAPGEPSWLKRRAFAALELEEGEEDEDGPPFEIRRGGGRYHALVGLDEWRVGVEITIAKSLSLECAEPVYSIECANDPWTVMSWRHGALELQEVDPGALAKSLGCPLPGGDEPSALPVPLRKVVLVEGVRAHDARRVLEEADESLPLGFYHLEDKQQGLFIASGTGSIGDIDLTVSERFPQALVYGITASPGLDVFFVNVLRGGAWIGHLAQPPYEFPPVPTMSEIKGERSPERILAALGIPVEWFTSK